MKLIRFKLWQEQERNRVSKKYSDSLWLQLSAAWDAKGLPDYRWYNKFWFTFGVSVSATVFALGSFGTAVFAYTNPTVTNGTPLYPLKQKMEDVEEKLQRTPSDKAQFYLKKISRREAEKRILKAHNKSLEEVEKQIDTVEEKLESTTPQLTSSTEKEIRLQKKVAERLQKRKERLEKKQHKLEQTMQIEGAATSTTDTEK